MRELEDLDLRAQARLAELTPRQSQLIADLDVKVWGGERSEDVDERRRPIDHVADWLFEPEMED